MGRASWYVLTIPASDYQSYIQNTLQHGFDAVEVSSINHWPQANHPPFNGNGDYPFLKRLDGSDWNGSFSYLNINTDAPDFTTPNEAYWSFVDGFLNYCDTNGIVVLLFPSYVGYLGGDQGWMQEMLANGTTRMQTYGTWIATRYRNQKNIIWMAGGDMGSYNQSQTDVEAALLSGMRSVPNQQSIQFSAEWDSETIGTDQPTFASVMTLNSVYSWTGKIASNGVRAYSHAPTMPSFLLEEPYDEEGPDGNNFNPNAIQPVRRFEWWGWLTTIGGYVAGNGYVWPFISPAWKNHLDTSGANDLKKLNAFIQSVAWWKLIPSGQSNMKTLITAGANLPSDSSYVAAAATLDGDLLVAYVPPAHAGSITVDMSAMSGMARARWLNPTSGSYTTIGSFTNTGAQVFTPPGDNGSGYTDWVLVLDR